MFFYVDESGNTGANLFDSSQPRLYYGVLSSKQNLDSATGTYLAKLRKQFGVKRLHAAELGNRKLALIAKDISIIQRNFGICFDVYYVVKEDHAVISFFDQVFDQGINPAVTWSGYWTPLRYMLLLQLASLFDREMAIKAWSARIELNNQKAEAGLVEVCREIRGRANTLPDQRSQQIITDALHWAGKNPEQLSYNVSSPRDMLSITPNIIGFQFVMQSIATRIKENGLQASRIVVDQQSQFNKAQRTLAEFYSSARNLKCAIGPGMPEIDLSGMPEIPIEFASGNDSAGLELVDIHLWVFKRFIEGKKIIPEMRLIIQPQLHQGRTDEISLNGLAKRWIPWFKELYRKYPGLTEEQMRKASELMAIDEARRFLAVRGDA